MKKLNVISMLVLAVLAFTSQAQANLQCDLAFADTTEYIDLSNLFYADKKITAEEQLQLDEASKRAWPVKILFSVVNQRKNAHDLLASIPGRGIRVEVLEPQYGQGNLNVYMADSTGKESLVFNRDFSRGLNTGIQISLQFTRQVGPKPIANTVLTDFEGYLPITCSLPWIID